MPSTDIVCPQGIFRGCFFYVQVRDRSALAVEEDIRFLRVKYH